MVWLWGARFPNRQSSVRLAYTRVDQFPNGWQFFAGTDFLGRPQWTLGEDNAVQLFENSSVGEFSVAWNHNLNKWLMLYGCPDPRGILCRWADDPWGPWATGLIIFDPWADHGYTHFMHAPGQDQVNDPTFENEWGGEYAPIIIPRYTLDQGSTSTIRYLMSTWNPYTVVLMETQLHSHTWRDSVRDFTGTLYGR